MKVVFHEDVLAYRHPDHPESPERVRIIRDALEEMGFEFVEPEAVGEDALLRVHTEDHVERVKDGTFFDPDTPPLDFKYVLLSASCAVTAAKENGFSLARPPGHHAGKRFLGGFCYVNNVAVALERVEWERAAIIDVDAHHGNGTEDIFRGREDVVYVSIHQHPLYPGTGIRSVDNCYNYPLPSGVGGKKYVEVLGRALEVVERFDPDVVAVSLGFDTHAEDPLTGFMLVDEDYEKMGKKIGEVVENRRAFLVLEGGYSGAVGRAAARFFEGYTNI